MLTDYHLHLRPDDPDTPPSRYFTSENAARYRAAATAAGIAELGVAEHIHRFVQSLDIWDHEWWTTQAFDDVDAYCAFVREDTDLRLGIEADFLPGKEDRIAAFLDARDWDYVVGSVHFLGAQAVDHDGWDVWEPGADPDTVWLRYFETLGAAAASGLFDILAHPDLVKIWGRSRPWPQGDLRRFYDLAIGPIAESGIAVEVSTAGLRKPIGEPYPDPAFLAMCVEAGCPVALSSDAHVPEQVGYRYDEALALLAGAGVTELAVFEGRERSLVPVGPAERV